MRFLLNILLFSWAYSAMAGLLAMSLIGALGFSHEVGFLTAAMAALVWAHRTVYLKPERAPWMSH